MSEKTVSVTVRMPGRFDMYFSGTDIGEGQYDENDPVEVMVRNAWVNSARRKCGPGYFLVIFLEGERDTVRYALEEFLGYAKTYESINKPPNEVNYTEQYAARSFMAKLETAIKEIG